MKDQLGYIAKQGLNGVIVGQDPNRRVRLYAPVDQVSPDAVQQKENTMFNANFNQTLNHVNADAEQPKAQLNTPGFPPSCYQSVCNVCG